jgi:hypothetical protein
MPLIITNSIKNIEEQIQSCLKLIEKLVSKIILFKAHSNELLIFHVKMNLLFLDKW